jgi:hypothetical protein
MTEEEAKQKWCPFNRLAPLGASQRYTVTAMSEAPDCNCIGSACMAWRATDNFTGPSAPGEPGPTPKPAGYCGLAGKEN